MARITVTIESNVIGIVEVQKFTGSSKDSAEHVKPSYWREEIEELITDAAEETIQIAKATSIVLENAHRITTHDGRIAVQLPENPISTNG